MKNWLYLKALIADAKAVWDLVLTGVAIKILYYSFLIFIFIFPPHESVKMQHPNFFFHVLC